MSDLLLNSHGASLKDAGRLTFAAAKMGAEVAYLETIKSVSRIAKRKGKPPKDTNGEA